MRKSLWNNFSLAKELRILWLYPVPENSSLVLAVNVHVSSCRTDTILGKEREENTSSWLRQPALSRVALCRTVTLLLDLFLSGQGQWQIFLGFEFSFFFHFQDPEYQGYLQKVVNLHRWGPSVPLLLQEDTCDWDFVTAALPVRHITWDKSMWSPC